MNHPIDLDPESNRRADPETHLREDSKHLKLLDTLVHKINKTLNNNGCSAILWDDQLLAQDAGINIHNALQENELEEK